jgi:hypothetical protein
MELAGDVECRSSMTFARFVVLQQKRCLVACYYSCPWWTELVGGC